MNVPPDNSETLDRSVGRSAFGADAPGYDAARSGYPDELFELLSQRVRKNPDILEIGAGTGLATLGLLRLSPRQLALLEPDHRLCDFLQSRFAQAQPEVICGTFPDPRVEGSFDLIACAAAFHWMEPDVALVRIRKLLAPGGTWAMWWNCYFGHGHPDPFGDRVSEILEDLNIALPPSYTGNRHYALDAHTHSRNLETLGFTGVQHHVFSARRNLDANNAKALYATFSFISGLPHAVRSAFLNRVHDVIQSEFSGLAPSLVVTSLYFASGGSSADQQDGEAAT
ncbi:trans-aconitate 2-methyltransferase [Novosphingobium sp.]|uniref:class I SAM-dependent methyltransferase n=1 Tax=Novosphingobium sp. TaxID=1874826 RepID=UPI00262996AD|nr:class I SAM-dependent methyltransferase [Novosphingobium sp.]